ncbi:hypothetical protein C8Q75DRAFT_893691 [Abortiporus biennis]|nr:hypothetical protein C8Q75DRAFT_893691 [Abortiporus biennis]
MSKGRTSGIWNPLCDGDVVNSLIEIALDEKIYAYKEHSDLLLEGYITAIYGALMRCIRCLCDELVTRENIFQT